MSNFPPCLHYHDKFQLAIRTQRGKFELLLIFLSIFCRFWPFFAVFFYLFSIFLFSCSLNTKVTHIIIIYDLVTLFICTSVCSRYPQPAEILGIKLNKVINFFKINSFIPKISAGWGQRRQTEVHINNVTKSQIIMIYVTLVFSEQANKKIQNKYKKNSKKGPKSTKN